MGLAVAGGTPAVEKCGEAPADDGAAVVDGGPELAIRGEAPAEDGPPVVGLVAYGDGKEGACWK